MVNLRSSTAIAKRFTLHRRDGTSAPFLKCASCVASEEGCGCMYPKCTPLKTEIEKESDGWRTRPIKLWSTVEVMQWIQAVAINNNLNYEEIQMHKFSDVSGSRLDKMQSREFMERDQTFGMVLYDALQRLQKLGECDREKDEKPTKKSRGRPPGSNKIVKTKKPRFRLWEFLLDLLSSPQYCPSMITWENQDEGLFKIVQSEKVAKLWGNFRGNKNMDYAKMTRLMRYYYHTQMLEHVKQRLVYRFGPNAQWKTKRYCKQDFESEVNLGEKS